MSPARGQRFAILLGLARTALLWERLWPALWPAAAVTGVFLAVALCDLLPWLPGWLHGLVLVAVAIALGVALRHAWLIFRPVDEASARRRLERDSDLSHRPLTALDDRLAGGADDPAARALWQAHLLRVAAALRGLRVAAPAPGMSRRDPYAVRAAVLLFLVIGLVAGGGEAGPRLGRAVVPQFGSGAEAPFALDIWITPPAYTHLAPLFLNQTTTSPASVLVPEGSAILAQASGTDDPPRLEVGESTIQFSAIGGDSYRVEGVIESGDRLVVKEGRRELAAWPLRVITDGPPTIEYPGPPSGTGRAHLRVPYEARDDYGIAGVAIVIRHPEGAKTPDGDDEIRLTVALSRLGSPQAKGRSIHDLSAHPWAGTPVLVRLEARDGRGQKGASEAFPIVLPERVFNHPIAREIIEQRKKLVAPSPGTRAEVAEALDRLTEIPARLHHDTVVYLALRIASERLIHGRGDEVVVSVQQLMWDTALRLEDGEAVIAERALRRAQDEIMRALRDGAANPELDRLLDELQRSLDKYLSALAEQMSREGAMEIPLTPNMRMIGRDELQRLIEQARELARTGSVEAARRMLAELQQMLNRLRAGMMPRSGGKKAGQARRLMDGLRALTQRQQALHDRTFRRSQGAEGRPGEGQQKSAKDPDAAAQEGLRRGLGDLMVGFDELFGNIPGPLGKAERAMRDAAEALEAGRAGAALPSQAEALSQLRRGMESAAEQIVRALGGIGVTGRQSRGREGHPEQDPFGRFPDGAFGAAIDGPIKVPDEMEIRRARKILEELRRRLGDRSRPEIERDYLERLLRQF